MLFPDALAVEINPERRIITVPGNVLESEPNCKRETSPRASALISEPPPQKPLIPVEEPPEESQPPVADPSENPDDAPKGIDVDDAMIEEPKDDAFKK